MNRDEIHPDIGPSPEQFAAFLDGELDPRTRARVETWLSQNPAAAAEIEGQRRLMRLWQANTPAEPSAAAWTTTFDRMKAKLRPTSRRPRALRRTLWLSAGLAAAVLVAVMLSRHFQSDAEKVVPPMIASTNTDPNDQEPILLASQDDVSVVNVEPYWQDGGRVPAIGEGDVSMIVAAPLGREP